MRSWNAGKRLGVGVALGIEGATVVSAWEGEAGACMDMGEDGVVCDAVRDKRS